MKEIKRRLVLDDFEYRRTDKENQNKELSKMEKSLFEQMGGTYKQVGDYLLPDVELSEEKPIGVWGTRHYHHLRKTKRILFSQLTISGKMNDYLADIDKQAEEMFSQLVKQLAERDGITETLKATNQMEWVRQMSAVRAQATEIINNELIYADK